MTYNKEHWKGSVITSPLPPTLVSCAHDGKVNVLTVAWTGILCTRPPVTYISVRPERYSYEMIKQSGEFVINLPTKEIIRAVDFCGVKTGSKTDKFAECGLHTEEAVKVSAPLIAECPVSIECKVREIVPLGSHDMFIADIVGIDAAKELLDDSGKLCLEKAGLIAYAHGGYFELGKQLGSFGYSVRKNKKRRR
ncbi:flavin reductase family protein [uncultured Ruminococcus sp.]|uniref:flavin reductase family protein n=1 Tax=uncultured Ruminococcus sp. TaxID=165186 RepID=UPI000EBCDC57|nr:flavin reductase family protein [uncultured Ruminococcus sp.]HCJ42402.1 flavin reductase family protein [Ruminococcus sp.]